MKLLTNIKINYKNDVIKVARFYLSRWRIEGKKQEYDFENVRIRTLDRWLSQMAIGIKATLSNAHNGLKKWQEIETRGKHNRQLSFEL